MDDGQGERAVAHETILRLLDSFQWVVGLPNYVQDVIPSRDNDGRQQH